MILPCQNKYISSFSLVISILIKEIDFNLKLKSNLSSYFISY